MYIKLQLHRCSRRLEWPTILSMHPRKTWKQRCVLVQSLDTEFYKRAVQYYCKNGYNAWMYQCYMPKPKFQCAPASLSLMGYSGRSLSLHHSLAFNRAKLSRIIGFGDIEPGLVFEDGKLPLLVLHPAYS